MALMARENEASIRPMLIFFYIRFLRENGYIVYRYVQFVYTSHKFVRANTKSSVEHVWSR